MTRDFGVFTSTLHSQYASNVQKSRECGVVMMGNHTSSNHKYQITAIQAAGKFKHAVVKKDDDDNNIDDVIRCIVNSYFRRKTDVAVSHSDNDGSAFILKYIQRHSVGGASRDSCDISDTKVAWNALRMSVLQEQDGHAVSPFKKLSSAIWFTRRVNPTKSRLQYDWNDSPDPSEGTCHFCEEAENQECPLLPCRLCTKVYHRECLGKRGHLSSDLQKEAIDLANTGIGWSCPSCESLFWLLSEVEQIDLMEMFDDIDTNHDSLISRQEYLEFSGKRHREETGIDMTSCRLQQENETFDSMDRDDSGIIDWWEFVTPMCVKILMKKPKHQLLEMLVPREIYKIKRYFRSYDPLLKGYIPSMDSRLAFKQWYISLINRSALHIPLSEWLGNYMTEGDALVQTTTSTVSWEQFLRRCAIFMISARPNTASTRPYIPRLDDVALQENNNRFTLR